MQATPSPISERRTRTRPIAVLFDLDGTLIDSIELILSSMRHAFDACGATAPADAEWLESVGIPLQTAFRRYAPGDRELAALIAAYREHQLAHHDRLVRCYDAVVETVSLLQRRGHPLAVVTSKADWLARRGLEHVGMASLFDTIVGCDSCSRHKPHPEPVLTALARLGYRPDEAVFVGDSVHDIEAGNAAGVLTVAALWGPFGREQLLPVRPDYFLDQISDLPDILSAM
jgi:pyrophosphatase PpaX